jgi:two-component system response regulator FixJ
MRTGNVYVIDDDASIRESLQSLLAGEGYAVHCFSSAERLLESTQIVAPGCLIIDLKLDGIDGLDLHSELTRRAEQLPVIFLTGHADVPSAVRAMRAGAMEFVEKPFEPEEFLSHVSSAMSRSLQQCKAHSTRLDSGPLLATLTPREREVLALVAEGLPTKTIAADLGISPRTVETHRMHLMDKLCAESLADLVRIWITATESQTAHPA